MKSLWREWLEMDVLDAAPRLTLILLAFHFGGPMWFRLPIILLCAGGFLFRALYREPLFWLLMSLVMGAHLVYDWHLLGGSAYLATYWCVALACSLASREPGAAIAASGRWLVGLCFAFAAVWKFMSGEFLGGGTLHFYFLTNDGFRGFAEIAGGMDGATLDENRRRLLELLRGEGSLAAVSLESTARMSAAARVATFWTVGLESFLAVLCLWPASKLRHGALVIFVLSILSFPGLAHFAWLLLVMGVAQCDPSHRRWRAVYGVSFVLVPLIALAWRGLSGAFQS